MNMFRETVSTLGHALDSDLRMPGWKIREFENGFTDLVAGLKGAYRVDQDIYGQTQALSRLKQDRSGAQSDPALNTAEAFLRNIQLNPRIVQEVVRSKSVAIGEKEVVKMGEFKMDPRKLTELHSGDDGFHKSDVIAILAHGAAKLELLLQGGDTGIPEVYARAIVETRKELALIQDAAKLAYNWDPKWDRLNVKNVLDKARGRITKGMVRKGLAVGSLAFISCMAPVDQNGVPTPIPGVVQQQSSEQTSVEVDATKTPTPENAESISQSPGKMVEHGVGSAEFSRLSEKYKNDPVSEYILNRDTGMYVRSALGQDERGEILGAFTTEFPDGTKVSWVHTYVDGRLMLCREVPTGLACNALVESKTNPDVVWWTLFGEPTGKIVEGQGELYELGDEMEGGSTLPGPSRGANGTIYEYNPGDKKFHPVEGLDWVFGSALEDKIAKYSSEFGGGTVVGRNEGGDAVIHFENGSKYLIKTNGELVLSGYTLEQLAEMSPSEIISLAPEVPEIQRPEWAVGEYSKEIVMATDMMTGQPVYAVVSRAENGRMFSAYNPETGQTHDWVSTYKGFAMFSENDPSLGDVENKYLNTGNESDPARAFLSIFVSNWEYRRKDKEPRISPDKLMRVKTGLITPEAKWALYLQMEEEFLREYKAGRIFDEGKHITIGDVQIKNELPRVVLVRGRDDNNQANSVSDRKNWMKLEYDVETNVLRINMFPPRRIYETYGEFGTGDELSILRALFAEKIGVGEGGTADWSSVLTLVFLDGQRIGEEMKDSTYGYRSAEEIPIAYPGFSPSKYNLVTSP